MSSKERTAVVLAVPRGPTSRMPPTEGLIKPEQERQLHLFLADNGQEREGQRLG